MFLLSRKKWSPCNAAAASSLFLFTASIAMLTLCKIYFHVLNKRGSTNNRNFLFLFYLVFLLAYSVLVFILSLGYTGSVVPCHTVWQRFRRVTKHPGKKVIATLYMCCCCSLCVVFPSPLYLPFFLYRYRNNCFLYVL